MIYEGKFELARISLKRDSSNSCKPSSTNGFKKVVQNNRIKSNKKPGREKGHKRSAPQVCLNPDKIIYVSKVATCSCGCHTIEKEDVKRDLISLEIIVYLNSYCNIPNQKTAELLGLLSENKIKMCQGTIGNTMK